MKPASPAQARQSADDTAPAPASIPPRAEKDFPRAEHIWLLMVTLTLAGAWLAETGRPGWSLTWMVAGLIALKGRLIIDHYMGIDATTPRIRAILHGFVTLVPVLVILSQI